MRPSRRSALPARRREALAPGTPGARRVDDDHVRVSPALAQLVDRLADVAGEEGRVRDGVQLGVLDRAGDRLLDDLDSPHRQRLRRQREPERADAAVEIPDGLAAGQAGELARDLVQPLRHARVGLEERVGAHAEAQAEQLLLDRVVAPEQLDRQVRHLGRGVVDRPEDRAHLGEAPQHLDQVVAIELLALGCHELDERLARVAAFPDDEVAQVAGLLGLVVGREALLARPVTHGIADRVAEVGGQPALLDLEHLVPAAGAVQAEGRPGGRRGERVLHLVAVVEDVVGRDDLLERRVVDAADPAQRLAHLRGLGGDLDRVVEILEAAAAAGRIVRAGSLDVVRPGRQHLGRECLGEAALDLRHACAHPVAGQAAAHEDDEAVEPGDAVAAVGERLDVELELLVLGYRRRHAAQGTRATPAS
jgi:hypothetical protein